MRHISKPVLIGGGVTLTAIAAFLAFGVFGVHTLFIDDEVAEANPFDVSATAPDDLSGTDDEATPTGQGDPVDDGAVDDGAAAERVEASVATVTSGEFVGNSRYTTVGNGFTITDGDRVFLRLEEFETDNGPDLNVYLRSSENPDDYLDLGDLKGNIGDQNYELPAGVDLDRYDLVDVWCVRFGVSFGSAQLA